MGGGFGGPGGGLGIGPPFTPPVIKQLLIALAVIFVLQGLWPTLVGYGAVIPFLVWQEGWLWQPFTYMWLHFGLGHILINAFMLWMFGSQLAMAWGARRFLQYYLVCGVGAGVLIATLPYLAFLLGGSEAGLVTRTAGASGAVYGVILAFSLTWPERTIALIFPPVAFKAIWLIPIMFFMNVAFDTRGDVSHVGHLGGVLAGWLFLRWRGEAGSTFSLAQLKLRWRRYRMRRKLRAVQYEDWESKRRERDDRTPPDDRPLH